MAHKSVKYALWKDFNAVIAYIKKCIKPLQKKVRWRRWKALLKNVMTDTRKLASHEGFTGKT